jgi:hypothetical protein
LQIVSIFQQKIKNSYNNYYTNRVKIGDMDDYLPITIFCVLSMNVEHLNLVGLVKMMISYVNDEEDYELERKILTNIEAAVDYIQK